MCEHGEPVAAFEAAALQPAVLELVTSKPIGEVQEVASLEGLDFGIGAAVVAESAVLAASVATVMLAWAAERLQLQLMLETESQASLR